MSDPKPTCRHGRETCVPCTTPGSGIGRRDAFTEHIANRKALQRTHHGGTHTLGSEYRTAEAR